MKTMMTALTALLIAFAAASAADAQEDFLPVPAGSVVVLPGGDSISVREDSRLVSDSAVVRIDSSLRRCERDLDDRRQQVHLLTGAVDSLRAAVVAEKAWRETTQRLLADQQPAWQETIENFGLTIGGFAVCRALSGPS